MRTRNFMTAAAAALCLLCSCEKGQYYYRYPIVDLESTYHFNFIIDDSVLYLPPKQPELLWVRLYDVDSHRELRNMYAYPSGLYTSVTPGNYDIVAYVSEKNSTKVGYDYDLSLLTAYTEVTGDSGEGKVIEAPSHLLYGELDRCRVPFVGKDDGIWEIDVPMASPFDSWRIMVNGVENLGYASKIQFYVTGQYKEMELSERKGIGRAVIGFAGRTSGGVIDTPFVTFGMIPDERLLVQLQIYDQAGYHYQTTVDLTAQKLDPMNTRHILTFDFDAVLQAMVPGGLDPTANEWDTHYEHSTIQ